MGIEDHKPAGGSADGLADGGRRNRLLETAVAASPNAVIITDATSPDNPAVYANPAVERVTGYAVEEVLGQNPRFLQGPYTDQEEVEELRRAVAEGREFFGVLRNRRKDGADFHNEMYVAPVRDESGKTTHFVGIQNDVTDRVRAEAALKESEERFRAAFENAPIGVTLVGLDNRYLKVNRAFSEMLGYREKDLLGKTSAEITHPDDVEKSRAYMRRVVEGQGQDLQKRYLHADGHEVWVLLNVALVRDGEGDPSHYVCQHRDVTERKGFVDALRRSEGNLAAAQRIAHVGSWEYDAVEDEAYWSDETYRILGFEPQSFVPTSARFLKSVHPDDREGVRRTIGKALEAGDAHDEMGYRVVRPDGSVRAVSARYEATRDEEGGRAIGLAGTIHDVTERRALEEELAHRAFHDPLTDLPNRTLLMDRLGHALARKERAKGEVAVMFMDLDNFKHVNDSLGHEAGDDLLVEVAARIRGSVRPEDTVARLGGDEFAVLLEDVGGEDGAVEVAERIARELSPPIRLGGREVFVTPSIGVALGGPDKTRSDGLLREADAAMYRAKARGKNRHAVFRPEMRGTSSRRLRLEGDLRRALEDPGREFRVFYQPEALVRTGRIVGVEALIRWEHPEQGFLPPAEFVPLAEETGLIVPLGRWVFREACRQAGEWRRRFPRDPGDEPLRMSVNLSARQFQNPGLLGEVTEALDAAGLEPDGLILEITESVLMEDAPSTVATLRGLRALGVKLAIDDFGTGYSSLSYLKRFPVDLIKIDRTIVGGLERDAGNAAIVAATVTLAHALGLRVVAEGVETHEEAAKLREMDCDMGQGYYWWRPSPPEAAATLIASSQPAPEAG